MNQRLNVSTGAGGRTTVRRNAFDQHLNTCAPCQSGASICATAESMWRRVCIAALRASKGGA